MHRAFLVFLKCTIQGGPKVDVLLIAFFIFMAEIFGGYWQILDRSGKEIILLSPQSISRLSYVLTTCPYFDILKFDVFNAGGPLFPFVTSVLHVGRLFYVHCHFGAKRFTSCLIYALVPLVLNLLMKSHLGSISKCQTVITIAFRNRKLSVY